MSTTLIVVLFVTFPLIGALCAIVGQYTRPWQVLFGAVLGVVVADVIVRAWSKHIIQSAMRGENVGVVAWSTDIDWRSRIISNAVLLAIALIVGGLVLLVRRLLWS